MVDPHTMHMMMGMMGVFFVVWIIMVVIVQIPFWVIFRKAGFAPALSLLLLLPFVNLVMLYVLAFTEWKVVPVSQVTAIPPRI